MAGVASTGPSPAVVNGTNNGYDAVGSVSQENSTSTKTRPNGLRQNSNGSARMPLSSLAPNRKDSNSTGRASHNRVEELGQSTGSLGRSGSESDSLLDLYNQSSGNVSRQNVSRQNNQGDNDIPENMYRPRDDDPEGWIHRDKLAKIESEELQAAGINLANARRTGNKNTRRETSRGRRSEERTVSVKGESEETKPWPLDEEDERNDWDFRTPEEIAADQTPSPVYSHPVLKKSGSKIPVLTSSPLPIPHERIERDTPLNRKRTISNSMSPEDGIPVLKTRMRRGSAASADGQGETDSLATTPVFANGTKLPTAKQSSPTKAKPKTGQPSPPESSTGKKVSVSTATRKPSTNIKNGTTPSPSQRPGTRSGELDRPRTAINRPEGDPPWLATMYKPDPMLPPDQQIIPTHARRQQQAQWEDAGAIPSTYDRNFSPLAIHSPSVSKGASPMLPSAPSPVDERDIERDGASWPLKPVASPNLRHASSPRPGTSGSTNGGYSTMPRVASPAIMHSPRMGNISTVPGQVTKVQRIEHQDEDAVVKDKSCGCCIVM
ncbi:hypothetical protein PV08_06054 [Exophiala spinifera]|uniref:Uncharacterized protein n=1 Tax=Exophiala spinifera TaxID=91928 RepID=A0A0D2BAP5_9EURO|nr:uncharacterized protein PV08_06054 [Exophiala spinifera]KIW16003.1 hypothetical protein PV08_06054 [Exophiala spinifera]